MLSAVKRSPKLFKPFDFSKLKHCHRVIDQLLKILLFLNNNYIHLSFNTRYREINCFVEKNKNKINNTTKTILQILKKTTLKYI